MKRFTKIQQKKTRQKSSATSKTASTTSNHPSPWVNSGFRGNPAADPRGYLMHLQRTVGNRGVGQFLKTGVLQAAHKEYKAQRYNQIQALLNVGPAGDRYEQEADRIADQVVSTPEPTDNLPAKAGENSSPPQISREPLANSITPLQRKEKPEEKVQGKVWHQKGGAVDASTHVASSIDSARGTGRSLPDGQRSYFEPRFGTSFSAIKIHTGPTAEQLSRAINARAFTVGNDIFFGSGEYSPDTTKGKHLMAHELTHTVQQGGQQRISLKPLSGGENKSNWEESLIYDTKEDADYQGRIRVEDGRALGYRVEKVIYKGKPAYQLFLKKNKSHWEESLIYDTKKDADYQGRIRIEDGRALDYKIEKVIYKGKSAYKLYLKTGNTKLSKDKKKEKPVTENKTDTETVETSKIEPPTFVLTFDDGPHTAELKKGKNYTETVLDTLKSKGIQAGFFIQTGVEFRGPNPIGKKLVKRMHEEGHTVGIHTGGTVKHEIHPLSQKAGRLKGELSDAKKYIKDQTGKEAEYVRPPEGKGAKDTNIQNIYKSLKLKMLLWDIDGDRDAGSFKDLKSLFNAGLQYVHGLNWSTKLGYPRIVILYHDIRQNTASNLAKIIDYITEVTKKIFKKKPKFKAPP